MIEECLSHVCHTEIDETRIFMGIYTIVETWCDRRKTQSLPRKKWCPGTEFDANLRQVQVLKLPLFSQSIRLSQQTKAQSLSTTLSTFVQGLLGPFPFAQWLHQRGGAAGCGPVVFGSRTLVERFMGAIWVPHWLA